MYELPRDGKAILRKSFRPFPQAARDGGLFPQTAKIVFLLMDNYTPATGLRQPLDSFFFGFQPLEIYVPGGNFARAVTLWSRCSSHDEDSTFTIRSNTAESTFRGAK